MTQGTNMSGTGWKMFMWFYSWFFIPNWLIKNTTKTILDLGCGDGRLIQLIRVRHPKIIALGVDIFPDYIQVCRSMYTHEKNLIADISKVEIAAKSYDLVFCSQVIEHLPKLKALALITKMEKTARQQVILSTPVGPVDYNTSDGNVYQNHKSYFYPNELKKLGYKIIKMGGKTLISEHGLAKRMPMHFLTLVIIILDILLTPIYLLFPKQSNYYFWAYKDLT